MGAYVSPNITTSSEKLSNIEPNTPWQAPPYQVRRSNRAKRCRFKVSARRGLEVILPAHAATPNIEALLYQHRQWIQQQFSRYQLDTDPACESPGKAPVIPSEVQLTAIHQQWSVEKVAYLGRAKWLARPGHSLVLMHDYSEEDKCFALLKDWLREQAKTTLTAWLQQISQEINLPFSKITIRSQSTRWGSCTEDKAISLNDRLLFFPEPVVRYILIHELCHTQHLNHSRQFWQLVESFDPHWRQHEKILKQEREYIPNWLR